MLSRFSKKITLLQWYEDAYFVYGQENGKVTVCDWYLRHCVDLWQPTTEQDQIIKKLEYIPDEDLWIVVRNKEVSTYTFE